MHVQNIPPLGRGTPWVCSWAQWGELAGVFADAQCISYIQRLSSSYTSNQILLDISILTGKLLKQIVAGGFYNMWMANAFKRMGGQCF